MRLAIIPARSGSKRILEKNIKPFLGKPIIAYSIEVALRSDLFDEVMVSTDSKEIADIAKQYGAKVPFARSTKNSDDYATTVDVLIEVIESYSKQGKKIETACCIYATAPFVTEKLLSKAYNMFKKEQYDSVFPAISYSFPIQRAIKITNSGKMKMFYPEHKSTRSQDLPTAYHDSGQFYWFNALTILKEKKLWTDNTGILILSELESHDIDTLEDWKIAEFKYRILNNINE